MCPYHRESLKIFDRRVQVPEHIVQIAGNSEGSFVQNCSPVVGIKHTQCSQTALIKRPKENSQYLVAYTLIHTYITDFGNYTRGSTNEEKKLHRKLSYVHSRQERTPVHTLLVCYLALSVSVCTKSR